MKYKVEHDRSNCIGCSACAAVAPEFWEMGDDGKSTAKGAVKRDDGWEVLEVGDADFAKNKQAADVCPVNVIHIKKENGEKVI
ncbi:ferredoxin [Candidatus Micrarchaeota archaeon CG08_land_8_20_14_0_20_49_17]|nr:MAG: ferredoxin [Candidatus Micrarchaeota archaeon CG08_land_8_20_14_0_20_49_17]PIU81445.1 MAG: ferredoxin [Candidatus Micrarchaeota archaeon CG06_land_8_20_14_3_00_50_6]PIZ96608.1 MAG: ferredoxin [Candidatus Micrarchaeota archaeon CG_4_10_14_0_2_um_filter_49_7]HII53388.1 ferredoxin [Candidatus Micrarchaeota archaeon]